MTRTGARPWSLGGLNPGELGRRVWQRFDDHDLTTRAASLAYYFLFALFPALLFLTALLGLLPIPGLMERLMSYLDPLLPGDAASLLRRTLAQTVAGANTSMLSAGVVGAIWSASVGMVSIINALNVANRVREPRPWWKRRLVAVALTIGLGVFTLTALVLVLFGELIGRAVARAAGLGSLFTLAWSVVQWPVVGACVLIGVTMVYSLAPAAHLRLRWLAPGAAFAVVAWLAVSIGLRLYVTHFGSYNTTYGSIGGVILLMLWFYASSLTLLVGAEINGILQEAAADLQPEGHRPSPVPSTEIERPAAGHRPLSGSWRH